MYQGPPEYDMERHNANGQNHVCFPSVELTLFRLAWADTDVNTLSKWNSSFLLAEALKLRTP